MCTVIVDSEHKTAPRADAGAEYALSVGTPHIRSGRLLLSDAVAVDSATYGKWTARGVPQSGDLILTREAPVGEVGMVPQDVRVCLRQRTVLLRPNPDAVNGKYLLYLLMAPGLQERMHSRGAGSTVPHLNIKDVRALSLGRLPHLPQQQAIAEVLGALDDKIALNEQIRETALSLGRSLLEKDVQESGAAVKLGDVAELVYGKALPLPVRREGGVPVFGCTGQVGWHDTALTKRPYPVVGRKGANAGHVSWMSRPGWIIDTAFYARPTREDMTSEGLYFILDAAGIGSLIGDSAVPGINRNAVLDHRVFVPNPGRVKLFARQAHSLLAAAEQTTNENRTLADLRDTLLPQLLSGKLRVKDAVRAVEEVV
ncbi:restriction endonuclease subunit S [Streptomyces sp. WAC 01325]|uniref:restriction endonuclease subunit S n=1 Tax=Streptomyces sp. WAC 01325 TaxID=2203202 RepID=UPI0037DA3B5F